MTSCGSAPRERPGASSAGRKLGWPHLHLRRRRLDQHPGSRAGGGRVRRTAPWSRPPSRPRDAGRQGRTWSAPAGRALLCSVLVRQPPRLLPLLTGVAVAEVAGPQAELKWPNDVLIEGRKVAGILVEGRPQEHWAVVGVGMNVAVRESDFPDELRDRAGTLGLEPEAIEPMLRTLLATLGSWLIGESGGGAGGGARPRCAPGPRDPLVRRPWPRRRNRRRRASARHHRGWTPRA